MRTRITASTPTSRRPVPGRRAKLHLVGRHDSATPIVGIGTRVSDRRRSLPRNWSRNAIAAQAVRIEVVSAHVANNKVATEELPKLINDVHRALANAAYSAAPPPKSEPAVEVKKSVRPDHLVCLECGKHFSMLKRHLATDHQLTPELYRQKWGLPAAYPIVAPNYAKVRSALAKKIGLGRKGSRPARKSPVRSQRSARDHY